jgi:transposase InsO family protein
MIFWSFVEFTVIIQAIANYQSIDVQPWRQLRQRLGRDNHRHYKTELIHRRTRRKTSESVELTTLQWMHWLNQTRLLVPIEYIPPAEAGANYSRMLAERYETTVSA